MPFASTQDGVRLYYESIGHGAPLLLIPGRGADHHWWNLVREDFSDRHRVIVYDPRGTGQSDKPESPAYTTRGLADDAIAVLDQLRVPRADVYGASLGGKVAQWCAIEHSDRVGGLVLAATAPGGVNQVAPNPEVRAIMAGSDPSRAMGLLFAHRRMQRPFFESVRPSLEHPVPGYVDHLQARASDEHDAWSLLPTIRAPTLILHGGADPVVPIANATLVAQRIPRAKLVVVRGGRHAFFLEYRRKVDRVVRKFLARSPLPS